MKRDGGYFIQIKYFEDKPFVEHEEIRVFNTLEEAQKEIDKEKKINLNKCTLKEIHLYYGVLFDEAIHIKSEYIRQ